VTQRQYRVTDVAAGLRTYVSAPYARILGSSNYQHAALVAGYGCKTYIHHRVRVELVREGCERPLGFDVLPLVVRNESSRGLPAIPG
jgi:hypothetical protein